MKLLFGALASIFFLTLGACEEAEGDSSSRSGVFVKGRELDLPGLEINRETRSVDVESRVCLEAGFLELVACTRGTKEHESIVAIEAAAIHVHTALLLLKAEAGNPASARPIDPSGKNWIEIPPRGSRVRLSLLVPGKKGKTVERPIRDFIKFAEEEYQGPPPIGEGAPDQDGRFPTDTFLFAGSILSEEKPGRPRRYLADQSGNAVSLSSFGDEMLCLPTPQTHQNGALMWTVDNTHLPPVGTKVTLRFRPEIANTRPSEKSEQNEKAE